MLIKLCKKYPKTKKLVKKIKLSRPEVKIKVKSCIGMCEYCEVMPTAIVEGKEIKKKSIKKFVKWLENR